MPLKRVVRPFQEFAEKESSSGILLIACTILALVWANSPWSETYHHFWHANLGFGFADQTLARPLHFWINDGIMAVFFLLIGLEVKREVLIGELASMQEAALPIAAALGGMVIPALIYLWFNPSGDGQPGWGIPVATDIAFALGVLTLLGDRIPTALRVFLAALAIADDIGAVIIIAIFYAKTILGTHLIVAGLCFAALIALNRAGARHPLWYSALGIVLWLAFVDSGIHATVAGVLLAITIPAGQRTESQAVPTGGANLEEGKRDESLMLRFEHALTPWVAYVIVPVFALANAGVTLHSDAANALVSPVSLGIICGLMVGKPVGITLFSWLSIRTGLATKPDGVSWRQIVGAGALAGIGFTMSIFIDDLAFGQSPLLETAKIGILTASLGSGILGTIILWRNHPSDVTD